VRRLLSVIAIVVAVLAATASPALADATDRAAAQILDSVPLPPTAKPTDIDDRVRAYTTTESPDAVLSFLRDELEADGWTEKSVGKAPANNNETSSNGVNANGNATNSGPETPGDRTTGSDTGTNSDQSNQQLTGGIHVRWKLNGATLKATIADVAVSDPQQVQGEDQRQTSLVLRARPPK
jgi:hypothetical protein